MKIQPDRFIRDLVSRAYPRYTGRKFRLHVVERPINCATDVNFERIAKESNTNPRAALQALEIELLAA